MQKRLYLTTGGFERTIPKTAPSSLFRDSVAQSKIELAWSN